ARGGGAAQGAAAGGGAPPRGAGADQAAELLERVLRAGDVLGAGRGAALLRDAGEGAAARVAREDGPHLHHPADRGVRGLPDLRLHRRRVRAARRAAQDQPRRRVVPHRARQGVRHDPLAPPGRLGRARRQQRAVGPAAQVRRRGRQLHVPERQRRVQGPHQGAPGRRHPRRQGRQRRVVLPLRLLQAGRLQRAQLHRPALPGPRVPHLQQGPRRLLPPPPRQRRRLLHLERHQELLAQHRRLEQQRPRPRPARVAQRLRHHLARHLRPHPPGPQDPRHRHLPPLPGRARAQDRPLPLADRPRRLRRHRHHRLHRLQGRPLRLPRLHPLRRPRQVHPRLPLPLVPRQGLRRPVHQDRPGLPRPRPRDRGLEQRHLPPCCGR
ncbi:hypothetical protein KEM52_003897, partial [Ascosphaera acerosa]